MMVIGLLIIAGIPTTIGVCEALSAQKKADAAAKEKAKFNMTATVSLDGGDPVECWCVLKEGRLWVDHPAYPMPGHKFTGYYFTYPSEAQLLGMVSTIADDPPMLNWIFVDKDNHMVRHGGRQETLGGHVIGPWHWSADEKWLTLEGSDADFVAVQVENKKWAIAWDRDGSIRSGGDEFDGESGSEEDEESAGDAHKEVGSAPRPRKWVSVRLRRKLKMGMESSYVKGANG
ncbi:hypothetical protein B0T22DRAFT_129365 [Podospora appendiculata]|uniref:Uncharacterized protein n=1 Tax=Podospora appendiculata TaxID=314037 RepID=A0AAE0X7E7_9PEZI|nr:hypothetical protein B0T22DRAFT_129365 [Podospora appendiculata]